MEVGWGDPFGTVWKEGIEVVPPFGGSSMRGIGGEATESKPVRCEIKNKSGLISVACLVNGLCCG